MNVFRPPVIDFCDKTVGAELLKIKKGFFQFSEILFIHYVVKCIGINLCTVVDYTETYMNPYFRREF